MKKLYKIITIMIGSLFFSNQTLANPTQLKLEHILHELQAKKIQNKNDRVAFLTKQFINSPYVYSDILSGGTEFNTASPSLYRLDKFDCQTFTQVILAFLHSTNEKQFNNTIQRIIFKDGKNDIGSRNNFPDGDWNPENRKQGFLKDATSIGELAPYAAYTYADITREQWNLHQLRKKGILQKTTFNSSPQYKFERVWISYLPKTLLLEKTEKGYAPNQKLFEKIPTPAVVEIVKDAKNWKIGSDSVRDLVGSELNVSHMGILYRQSFRQGELIYHKIYCDFNQQNKKSCTVEPVFCDKKQCNELMLAHATASHPNHFYWYATSKNNYACSADKPSHIQHYSDCNRVEREPLSAYLMDYQYGWYWYLLDPVFLGIHIEKIV